MATFNCLHNEGTEHEVTCRQTGENFEVTLDDKAQAMDPNMLLQVIENPDLLTNHPYLPALNTPGPHLVCAHQDKARKEIAAALRNPQST